MYKGDGRENHGRFMWWCARFLNSLLRDLPTFLVAAPALQYFYATVFVVRIAKSCNSHFLYLLSQLRSLRAKEQLHSIILTTLISTHLQISHCEEEIAKQ